MTDHGEKILLTKLKTLIDQEYDQEEIINQTIASGWKGFFPVHDSDVKNKNTEVESDALLILKHQSKEDAVKFLKKNKWTDERIKQWMNIHQKKIKD